jgi:putative DNA primase/helicase
MVSMGIGVGNGKHGPCPVCGGVDRFRFDDREGRGTWYCNQCGAGDGWTLVQRCLGIDFAEAVLRVAAIVGDTDATLKTKPKKDIREALRRLYVASRPVSPGDPVACYLSGRGLDVPDHGLRYCPKCWESETQKHYPAMIAIITSNDDRPISLHRTYLTKTSGGWQKAKIESPKKLMPGLEKLQGACVRLFPTIDTLGISEGVETAIASYIASGTPTWAAISATNMISVSPSSEIKRVVIFGDNDINYTGQKAAFQLAGRLKEKGTDVDVRIPDSPGTDWADYIQHQR